MAHLQYLKFNGEDVPLPVSYQLMLSDVEAESSGVTEAGTRQRDVVREGVMELELKFRVSKLWLGKLVAYKRLPVITVGFLDSETMEMMETEMFVDGFQERLVKDTSYGGLWEVAVRMREF